MAYIEGGKVVIHAFHESEMERMFKKLGIWGAFEAGEIKCIICKKTLNHDNFGALVPYKGEVRGACEGICVYKAQRLVEGETEEK